MSHYSDLSRLLDKNPRLAKLAKDSAGLPEIASLLLELRQYLGISQKEFAKRAGLPKTMVSELENAANDGITLKTLAKIAKGGNLKLNLAFEAALVTSEVGAVRASLAFERYIPSVVDVEPISSRAEWAA